MTYIPPARRAVQGEPSKGGPRGSPSLTRIQLHAEWLKTLLSSKIFLAVLYFVLRDGIDWMRCADAIFFVEYLPVFEKGRHGPDVAVHHCLVGASRDQPPVVLSSAQAREHIARVVSVGVPCARVNTGGGFDERVGRDVLTCLVCLSCRRALTGPDRSRGCTV